MQILKHYFLEYSFLFKKFYENSKIGNLNIFSNVSPIFRLLKIIAFFKRTIPVLGAFVTAILNWLDVHISAILELLGKTVARVILNAGFFRILL